MPHYFNVCYEDGDIETVTYSKIKFKASGWPVRAWVPGQCEPQAVYSPVGLMSPLHSKSTHVGELNIAVIDY